MQNEPAVTKFFLVSEYFEYIKNALTEAELQTLIAILTAELKDRKNKT